ncbi:MAG: hypothetical protein CV081_06515 [Nitrospira sp. LK265]|nr:DUF6335 family protein [Nitrospira sp.]NGZ60139.1 hypothetical protein [Nitrospira sp. LK265]
MSKPKQQVDGDRLIRRYYEGEETGQQGVFPEDTLASVPHVDSQSSDEMKPDTTLSGGDVDATWSGTDGGEEAVGGSTPTPDQDVVDELGEAVGITYDDAEPLRLDDKVADRDAQRWELNPASSEGYQERLLELASPEIGNPKRPLAKRRKPSVRADASSRKTVGSKKTQNKKRHRHS